MRFVFVFTLSLLASVAARAEEAGMIWHCYAHSTDYLGLPMVYADDPDQATAVKKALAQCNYAHANCVASASNCSQRRSDYQQQHDSYNMCKFHCGEALTRCSGNNSGEPSPSCNASYDSCVYGCGG